MQDLVEKFEKGKRDKQERIEKRKEQMRQRQREKARQDREKGSLLKGDVPLRITGVRRSERNPEQVSCMVEW